MRPPVFARQLASLDDVLALWHEHGGRRHGPGPVTHSQHALWTAALARQAGAGDALVTAALFHDFGYLLHMAGPLAGGGLPSMHDVLGATTLAEIFPPEVTEPIRLHEEAGRFLSWQQADYPRRLADAQRRDLSARGGPSLRERPAASWPLATPRTQSSSGAGMMPPTTRTCPCPAGNPCCRSPDAVCATLPAPDRLPHHLVGNERHGAEPVMSCGAPASGGIDEVHPMAVLGRPISPLAGGERSAMLAWGFARRKPLRRGNGMRCVTHINPCEG